MINPQILGRKVKKPVECGRQFHTFKNISSLPPSLRELIRCSVIEGEEETAEKIIEKNGPLTAIARGTEEKTKAF